MAGHDFCERDYAVSSVVRDFWCVATIAAWTVFVASVLYQRWFQNDASPKRAPRSVSGSTYLALTFGYFVDGIRLHAGAARALSLLSFHALFLIPFAIETRCYAIPIAVATPTLLSSLAPQLGEALEAPLSPVHVWIVAFLFAPVFVRLGLLPATLQRALDTDPRRKWSMIVMLFGVPLAKSFEARNLCHVFHTGLPLIDEFFTPHNVLDHMTCYAEYQVALVLDHSPASRSSSD